MRFTPRSSRSQVRRSVAIIAAAALLLLGAKPASGAPAIDLANRREPFVDRHLIGRLDGCEHRLHAPQPAGTVLRFDAPWEGRFTGYGTVIQDGARFRLYYRGNPTAGADGSNTEVTCCAESTNGLVWTKPLLGLFEVHGTRSNNVILAGQSPFSHNFAPFLDERPGIPKTQRYKALAGTSSSGLHGFISADGIHWSRLQEPPLIRNGAFDSQNVAFWSSAENRYVAYFRTWSKGEFAGFRTISRSTSTNFTDWTPAVPMTFGGTDLEHLYTSQTHPYFRAPHVYVALPMRFVPGRQVLSDAQARALGVNPGYAGDAAETVFMTSRGGTDYDRTFMEGFIRPGPDPGNWASRAGLSVLGLIQTGPAEMSLYKQAHYAQPSAHLIRYTLRLDGFASIHAPFRGGTFTTRPFRFSGRELVLNLATGAAGGVFVEIQDADGKPISGFTRADAIEQAGDEIERVVTWKSGTSVASVAGREIRLQFTLKDADLYALQFR